MLRRFSKPRLQTVVCSACWAPQYVNFPSSLLLRSRGFFVDTRYAKPFPQFRFNLGESHVFVAQHHTHMIQKVRNLGDQVHTPASPASPAASTTSAASSKTLAPIASTPPANSFVGVRGRRRIGFTIFDHSHQVIQNGAGFTHASQTASDTHAGQQLTA